DGTETPAGEETRREVAVIKDGVDAGGSYVFVQRWEHNLKQLNRMSVPDQEMMIGRTKDANEEIDGDERPVTSHLSRVDLKEDGKGLKIVRQSLPYGTASGTHGLYFCAYCARLYNIEQQLLSMFGDTDGKRDAMLRFTKPVTGGYYFAPSLERIQAL
ncbi:Dyp-type peroxidase, partial [Klebsiella pneumoniae]